MKCKDLLLAISEYIDGELDPSLVDYCENHLACCEACRVVVDNIEKTVKVYQNDQLMELPTEFRDKLNKELKEKWKETYSQ